MIKKALHRITVIWCLYGLARLLILVHPYLLWLCGKINPNLCDGSIETSIAVWLILFVVILVIFLAGAGIHHFSNWFFNSDTKN